MNEQQLTRFGIKNAAAWVDPLNEVFERFQIDTPQRQAAFLGQCAHESGMFTQLKENLNYSATALRATWPKRFPDDAIAKAYERQPVKIANKVYADRMGNGSEASGEPGKYLGRGLIQLTGKTNYKACGDALGLDLVGKPEQVEDPAVAALSAGWFWERNKLNGRADAKDWTGISKVVNGGTHGLGDRIAKSEKALAILS